MTDAVSVPLSGTLPAARTIGLSVGTGRMAIGAFFLAAPVTSVRLLGLDTATAARIAWLARMTAARDTVLGAGTVAAAASGGPGAVGWLVAGAASDAVDAVVLAAALREGRIRGWRPRAIAVGALGAAVLAGAAAAEFARNAS